MLDTGCINPVSIFIQHQVSSIVLLYIVRPMPLKSLGKKREFLYYQDNYCRACNQYQKSYESGSKKLDPIFLWVEQTIETMRRYAVTS
jgi:hypothetical protein